MNTEERKMLLKQLGLSIKLARVRKELSQEELAELAGLHRTYIGMVERAERNITVINLVQIAKALDISLDKLFDNSL
ncbi:helix-turn-helix transcriptional regulator [Haemophilus parahaemolyticus]|jgi:XRE family transcriptional regulator|uniref:XRE family transcriptional regulator n=2 Tax=Haemophilus parahaemolyticus TaxID=735 RepID=A0A369ZM29_HAEPH|nr:helix-turn-helix transcriptional regulator [Haemophilus parahaemolyticus]EIJ73705.1 restriction-modification system control element Bcll [Haemophilus parahaemolyticus HK385]MDQ6577089.1 helix-turn-helix transcriptional regulator [Haemophilus parahaemolyticus]MDU4464609.1 helix-turn-helix transcriptional regulator [Haemophilus parahaemolyticus]OOR95189.1 transcriptional regulator [Haemophilus parahaemolyticus]QEN10615.1 XRE family transcriptional regulator [Haemophilus parahaemolyticus]